MPGGKCHVVSCRHARRNPPAISVTKQFPEKYGDELPHRRVTRIATQPQGAMRQVQDNIWVKHARHRVKLAAISGLVLTVGGAYPSLPTIRGEIACLRIISCRISFSASIR